MNKPTKLCLAVPCYNEESILRDTAGKLLAELDRLAGENLIDASSFILFTDDGSKDRTWEIIEALHAADPVRIAGLKLAGNRGHQTALFAGLMHAKDRADAVVSLDADLQDDIGVIGDFVKAYQSGSDIVYGVRSDRSSDTFFKRFSAECFYRLLRWLGVKTVFNHADYRLMDRRALDMLAEYGEINLYLRGLIPLIGLKQSVVEYRRQPSPRPTRYPLGKMLMLAWDGITGFSVRPIRLISLLGLAVSLIGLILLVYVLSVKIFGYTVDGWTSIVTILLFFGGIQLLSIGVIGEYIAKTYMEVKARPRYHVAEIVDNDAEKKS